MAISFSTLAGHPIRITGQAFHETSTGRSVNMRLTPGRDLRRIPTHHRHQIKCSKAKTITTILCMAVNQRDRARREVAAWPRRSLFVASTVAQKNRPKLTILDRNVNELLSLGGSADLRPVTARDGAKRNVDAIGPVNCHNCDR